MTIMTIVKFVTAQLDDDEAIVRAAPPLRHRASWSATEKLLAHIAKDRAILALHARTHLNDYAWCAFDKKAFPCNTVRLLAAIYADHPDYDADWKPQA